MDGHAKFAFCRQNAGDPAAAAHPHILGQRDFGRHHESQFDRIAFRHLEIGVEERSTSAQVLGEAAALALGSCQPNSDRELKVEALRRAALKVNLIGAHDFSDTRRSNIGLLHRGDIEGDYLRIAGNSRVNQCPALMLTQISWKLRDKPTSNIEYSTPRRSGAEAGSSYNLLNFQLRATPAAVAAKKVAGSIQNRETGTYRFGYFRRIYRVIIG